MNIVVGTKLIVDQPVFTGSYRNAKYSHNRVFEAVVIKDSYGPSTGHHNFTLEVITASDDGSLQPGDIKRIRGKNLYPNSTIINQPKDLQQKADEKTLRKNANVEYRNLVNV